MTREIKFRGWHKPSKHMWEPEEVATHFSDGGHWFDDNDTEYMQFTGLKDKNGKEIYEGDIIKISWADGGYGLGVMRYTDENAQFHWYEEDAAGYGLTSFDRDIAGREVIGNIYENPELLTK